MVTEFSISLSLPHICESTVTGGCAWADRATDSRQVRFPDTELEAQVALGPLGFPSIYFFVPCLSAGAGTVARHDALAPYQRESFLPLVPARSALSLAGALIGVQRVATNIDSFS